MCDASPGGEGTMEQPVPPVWHQPADLAAAKAAQQALAAQVVREDAHGPVRLIGGVDISSTRFDREPVLHGCLHQRVRRQRRTGYRR